MTRADSNLALVRHGCVAVLALVVFVPLIAIAFFTQPSADDFCFAASMRDQGFIDAQVSTYMNWSGRYASDAMVSLLTGHPGWMNHYAIVPIALLLLTLAAATFLARVGLQYLRAPSNSGSILGLGVIATTLLLTEMHSLTEMIYWTTGAVTYHFGFILLMLGFAVALRAFETQPQSRFAIATLLLFINSLLMGFNEITMLVTLLLWSLLAIVSVLRSQSPGFPCLVLCVSAVAALAAILAPGNALRASTNAHKMDLFEAAMASQYPFQFTILDILFSASFWLFVILFILLLPRHAGVKIKSSWIWLIIVSAIGTVAAGIVAPKYAVGYLPSRMVALVTEVFVLGLIAAFALLTLRHVERLVWVERLRNSKAAVAGIFTLAVGNLLSGSNPVTLAYRDLLDGSAQQYSQQLTSRFAQIGDAQRAKATLLEVDALRHKPGTLFFDDIRADPKDWRNVCYIRYFQIPQIRTKRVQ